MGVLKFILPSYLRPRNALCPLCVCHAARARHVPARSCLFFVSSITSQNTHHASTARRKHSPEPISEMSKSRGSVFIGSLPPKKKQELQDISDALGLSSAGSTKEELVKLIKTHLEDNETKHINNPQFAGLYPSGRKKKSAVPTSTSQ
jgi:hypothetical protein